MEKFDDAVATFDQLLDIDSDDVTAYLTKGLWIHFRDERSDSGQPTGDREINFYFEGGIVSFVRHLNRGREVIYQPPISIERCVPRNRSASQPPKRGVR